MQKESSDNKIKDMMTAAIKDLNSMVDVNTIIGKPFTTEEGKVIIPFSKVTFGYLTGGGEYGEVKSFTKEQAMPFSGGSGAVVSLKPSGFLIEDGNSIKILNVSNNIYERVLDNAEEFIKGLKNED